MENQINLDLITVTDPSILRAIRHVRTQKYSDDAVKKDPSKATEQVCIFAIGNKTFSADLKDEVSKLILDRRQNDLYSISFTEGKEYTNSQGQTVMGINFSSFLTKVQHKEDIDFEQEIILSKSKAELSIMEQKARIAKSYGDVADVVRLQTDNVL